MTKININQVTYPKTNGQTQVCINTYEITNVNIELKTEPLYEENNINFDLSINYIDYERPGNVFQLATTSLNFTNDNIPCAFSDIVSLCKLQTNILAQLSYVPNAWDSTTIYNINDIVSFTINNLTYTYMSIADANLTNNTLSDNIGFAPNLYYNYWQLQEYSSIALSDINSPTNILAYKVGYEVYYNQNYYDANSTKQYATPSKKGIYTCNTPTWSDTESYNKGSLVYYVPSSGEKTVYLSTIDNNKSVPGTLGNNWVITFNNPQPPIIRNSSNELSFNTTYWTLQTWDGSITYNKNYMVYYPFGSQILYISLVNNNFNKIPSENSTYWVETTL